MDSRQFLAIAPILVLGIGVTLVMLQVAITRSARLTRYTTMVVLLATALSSLVPDVASDIAVTALLNADRLALLFAGLFSLTALVSVVLSRDYLPGLNDQGDEYYLLLLLATLGGIILVFASHAASLLLGLELLSVSLYALIAYPARVPMAAEAATKYLVLSGGATATLLFGFALLYAASGSLSFTGIGDALSSTQLDTALVVVAAVLIVSGVAFKLSASPFHLWVPDVYEGSPAPVTAVLATVAKAAPFIALLRFLTDANLLDLTGLLELLGLLAILSMLVGNLLALLQKNIKRILAYSSVAHMGYALIVLVVAQNPEHQSLAAEAGVFFFCAYLPTTAAAFGVLALLNTGRDGNDEADEDFITGLFWREPLLALLFLIALLSLAGIPLTAGFIGKLYLFAAAVAGAHWVMLAFLVLGSAIGVYYYLRIVYRMSQKPEGNHVALQPGIGVRMIAVLLTVSILALGIVPQSLMTHIRSMF